MATSIQTVRQAAERIIFSESLEDKLAPIPRTLCLDPPHKESFTAPTLPKRTEDLRPRKVGSSRTKIPNARQLNSDEHRSTLLHFFCNHELLAVELMALALLKFPDAPDAFRKGLLHTLREEQEHTRLYLARMRELGLTFGEHTLSSMIWDHIAPMESPLEYVSRLSLTFEQANLDYANYYSKAFQQAGDAETAQILNKIYHDEIAHVGYGLKWLRRFKKQKESDWEAWHRSLHIPLTPVRAKAPEKEIPFNEEGRRKAGLEPDFISQLRIFQRSRGRTPNIHYFNPNCERATLAHLNQKPLQLSRAEKDIAQDLASLMMANSHVDDVVLVEQLPSSQHLANLQARGLPLCEFATPTQLTTRQIGSLAPWAWSFDSQQSLQQLATQTNTALPEAFQDPDPEWLSKAFTHQLRQDLGFPSHLASSKEEALAVLDKQTTPVILKAAYACAGRSQFRTPPNNSPKALSPWLDKVFQEQPQIIIEPLLYRQLDFSALYDVSPQKPPRLIGFTKLLVDEKGRYQGTETSAKFTQLLPTDLAKAFHQPTIHLHQGKVSAQEFYRNILPAILTTRLKHYQGPISVDGLFYRHPKGTLAVHPLIELNIRCSMGRLAHNLRLKLHPHQPGRLRIHRVSPQTPSTAHLTEKSSFFLNDPQQARAFLASWTRC